MLISRCTAAVIRVAPESLYAIVIMCPCRLKLLLVSMSRWCHVVKTKVVMVSNKSMKPLQDDENKVTLGIRASPARKKKLKQLALDRETSVQALVDGLLDSLFARDPRSAVQLVDNAVRGPSYAPANAKYHDMLEALLANLDFRGWIQEAIEMQWAKMKTAGERDEKRSTGS